MTDLIGLLLIFAERGGKGDNPEGGTGVLIIIGTIVLAIAVVVGIAALVQRRTRG